MEAQRKGPWGQGRVLEEVVSKLRGGLVGDTQMICMFYHKELEGVKDMLQIEGPACAKTQRQQSESKVLTEIYEGSQSGWGRDEMEVMTGPISQKLLQYNKKHTPYNTAFTMAGWLNTRGRCQPALLHADQTPRAWVTSLRRRTDKCNRIGSVMSSSMWVVQRTVEGKEGDAST